MPILASTLQNLSARPFRRCRNFSQLLAAAFLFLISGPSLLAQTNVLTQHNDISRSGANVGETLLTPGNVNTNTFGKIFTYPVDGRIYAQPLYVHGVVLGAGTLQAGTTHNVVFVATEHDSVYAFDADSNAGANSNPLWQITLLDSAHGAAAGATSVPNGDVSTNDIVPELGITGTPVIDLSTNTIYLVGKTKENAVEVERLHALDITTGAEKFTGPVALAAQVPGTGNGSTGGTLTFDPMWENQRPGLLLLNGIVYLGFAAHGDNGPWHGWILAYSASKLTQTGVWCTSPNGIGAGVWMSGSGLAADQPTGVPFGRMFVATGNGDYTGSLPYTNNKDYGDSIVRLDLTNGVPTVSDEFTPSNQASLDSSDEDVASGGVLLLPDQTGAITHNALQVGKEGKVYVTNREGMGGYTPAGDTIQEVPGQTGGLWSMPAYWNNSVYFWGNGNTLKAFSFTAGQLSATPTSNSGVSSGFPGATPAISANGTSNGIVWAARTDGYNNNPIGSAILYAFDATNVATQLYNSSQNTCGRDTAGGSVKFVVPTVTNGKVYLAAAGELDVYGLLGNLTQAATPVISPASESFAGSLTVTITDTTAGATIYYTVDGSNPTTASTVYTGPFAVSTSETVNAIATASGFVACGSASQTYTLQTQTPAPTFNPAGGSYTSTQSVTLSDSAAGANIYYTTNGSTPSTSSTLYTVPISVAATATINALATSAGLSNSPVASSTYTIVNGATGFSYGSGFSSAASTMTFNGSTDLDDTRLQLTNGAGNEAGSAFVNTAVNIQAFTTDFTYQLSNPAGDGMTFTIQGNSPTALGPAGGGLGYGPDTVGGTGGIPKSVAVKFDLYSNAGEGPDSTGLYLNGASPTTPFTDLTPSGIDLHSGDTMTAHITYDGTTLTLTITDAVANKTFTTSWPVNIPANVGGNTAYVGFTGGTGGATSSQKIEVWTFVSTGSLQAAAATPVLSLAAGTYLGTQTLTITDATSGAAIYYTTNGTTPTTASSQYTAPLAINASETIEAIAIANGFAPSVVASAAYVIESQVPTPTFAPAAGTYTAAQSVAISDTTAGTTIFYTIDGSTPTTSSTKYTAPISVGASETLKALATESGFFNSNVATAAYTINLPVAATPAFSPAAGTYATAQSVTITDSTTGATIYYTTNGTTPTTASTKYTAPISVTATTTLEALAVATGFTNSAVASGAYTITPVAATPAFSPAAGTYATAQSVTITDATTGATIYYTTNGTTPTTASTKYTAPISITATTTLTAIAVATGFTNSAVASALYAISPVAATPAFSPAAGTYTTAQSVTIADTTTGATIYYTTNGTTPSTASTKYTVPVSIAATTTLNAIAVATGFTNSAVASGMYTITPVTVATPAITPATGTFTVPQSVTITDATAGSSIFYTTDGSAPTSSSTKYTAPFTVSTTSTIRAIATAPSDTNSAIASATITVQAAGGITFASGFTTGAMTLNGTAALNGSRLRLTDGGGNEAGAAWFPTPVNVQTFTSDFTFQLSTPVADGMTFTIQNTGATAIGPSGGGLGYGPDNVTNPSGSANTPIAKSVAVKFDIYSNAGEGTNSTGLYTNGASPTTPATTLGGGVNLLSGDILKAHITYDGTTLTLTVSDTVNTADTFTTSFPVNIPSIVGANTAFVGFTGGTGGSTATQEIITWTYSNTVTSTKTPIVLATTSLAAVSSGPTFRQFAYGNFPDANGTILDATKAGDNVTFTVNVATAGTYDVKVSYKKYNTRGTWQLAINGVNAGPVVDEYIAADSYATSDLGNISFPTAGNYSLKFTVTGKNANSSGFTMSFDDFTLTPQ